MPLFRRDVQPEPETEPIVTGDGDLRRADRVLTAFERVAGTHDAAMRAAALEIARAGGSGSMADLLRDPRFLRDPNTADRLDRPWRWLAAVADEAARRGELMLVARICLFTEFWCGVIAPHLMLADHMDIGLGDAGPAARLAIAAVGLACLVRMDPAQLVPPHARDAVPVSSLWVECAVQVERAASEGAAVDGGLLAVARQVLG